MDLQFPVIGRPELYRVRPGGAKAAFGKQLSINFFDKSIYGPLLGEGSLGRLSCAALSVLLAP